jgi:N-methylhydantoinase A
VKRRIGVDVGGTFTDFLVIDPDGTRQVHKTSSVPADPARAVAKGLAEIAEGRGLELGEFLRGVDTIVHGTTVTTNALLTRRGPVTGLLTTEGFRDSLVMRDGTREEAYDNRLPQPDPLVPRHLRRPVAGRLDYAGGEVEPLDLDDVRRAADSFRASGVQSVAICFMHSHADGRHEHAAAGVLREELPGVYLTISSELLAQARYYARTSTAVLNSYAGPIMSDYLEVLTGSLEDSGFGGLLLIMQSNGGVATPDEVARRAALSLLSGPASGPTAGLLEVAPHGWDRCLTVDMGGTSFDAAVVKDGRPLVMTDGVIDRWRLALPMVDIHTIGAGGGSIASVDEGGMLRVGPQSAGAVPGPASYGRGGVLPTTTDADVVLGYLDPDSFGGGMRLDVQAARDAIEREVAKPLGLSVTEAAAGIYDLVNVSMAAGVREITVRRGLDPRDFPIVVAGGAGPVHAAAIARELEIPILVTPRESAIFCAAGMLVCDFKHDYVRSMKVRLEDLDLAALRGVWQEMAATGRDVLRDEGVPDSAVSYQPTLDMRYAGQWFEINLPLGAEVLDGPDVESIEAPFHELHDSLFGYRSDEMPIEIINVRLSVVGATSGDAGPRADPPSVDVGPAVTGSREIWSPSRREMVEAQVYAGLRLGPGDEVAGPAIIELGTTTIVVLDEYDVVVDVAGSYVMHLRSRAAELLARIAT